MRTLKKDCRRTKNGKREGKEEKMVKEEAENKEKQISFYRNQLKLPSSLQSLLNIKILHTQCNTKHIKIQEKKSIPGFPSHHLKLTPFLNFPSQSNNQWCTCQRGFKHLLMTSRRWEFSKAAATRSLSFSCLLMACSDAWVPGEMRTSTLNLAGNA